VFSYNVLKNHIFDYIESILCHKFELGHLAVYFRNSSNGILPSPRGARLGCGGAKCAAPPRTLTILSFSLAEYKFERGKHAQ
jgi:hypothetical protein